MVLAKPQLLAWSPVWLQTKAPRMVGNSASIWFQAWATWAVVE